MADNIFEGLDQILTQQKQAEARSRQEHEEILEAINAAKIQSARDDGVQQAVNQRNRAFSLKNFINRSVHEYMWIGPTTEFAKEKTITVILVLASIVAMIVCTVVASVSFGLYSTFTLLENIWLLLMLCVLKYTCKAKKTYSTIEFSCNCMQLFTVDSDGVLRIGAVKKKYKFFLAVACISFLLNIVCIWVLNNSVAIAVTVVEAIAMVLSLVAFYKALFLFAGYGPIRFTGMNDRGTAKVSLVFDPLENQLYIEADFFKKFPYMQ